LPTRKGGRCKERFYEGGAARPQETTAESRFLPGISSRGICSSRRALDRRYRGADYWQVVTPLALFSCLLLVVGRRPRLAPSAENTLPIRCVRATARGESPMANAVTNCRGKRRDDRHRRDGRHARGACAQNAAGNARLQAARTNSKRRPAEREKRRVAGLAIRSRPRVRHCRCGREGGGKRCRPLAGRSRAPGDATLSRTLAVATSANQATRQCATVAASIRSALRHRFRTRRRSRSGRSSPEQRREGTAGRRCDRGGLPMRRRSRSDEVTAYHLGSPRRTHSVALKRTSTQRGAGAAGKGTRFCRLGQAEVTSSPISRER